MTAHSQSIIHKRNQAGRPLAIFSDDGQQAFGLERLTGDEVRENYAIGKSGAMKAWAFIENRRWPFVVRKFAS